MGLRSTRRDERYKRCRPRVSGDPRPVDSRFRGNDVTFDGVKRGISPCLQVEESKVEGRKALNSSTLDFSTYQCEIPRFARNDSVHDGFSASC
jgi:hypothetical protein